MSEEMEWRAELRYMLLYLCLDRLSNQTQGGFHAHFNADEAEDVLQLYLNLRVMVKKMALAAAAAMRAAADDNKEGD